MTSSHKHSTTGKLALAGTIDKDVPAAVAAHVATYHPTVPVPPEPPVPPSPGTRPFPAPVTPNKVDVPASAIASADAFASFVAAVPPGSWFKLPATSVGWAYGMVLSGRRNLLIDASAFKLTVTGTPSAGVDKLSGLTFRDCQDVAVLGLTAQGGYGGTPALPGAAESTHLVNLSGWYSMPASKRIEVAGLVGSQGYSDGVYIEGQNAADQPPAQDIWVHHSAFTNMGRNLLSLINCDRVLFEDCTADRINYHVFDFEDNSTAEQTTNVTARRNKVGSYALRPGLLGFFAAAVGNADVARVVGGIELSDNTVQGTASDGYEHQPRGISSMFVGGSANHFRDIKFLRNTSPQPLKPDSFYASYCDGVVVEGVPASSVMTPNCTGVVVK